MTFMVKWNEKTGGPNFLDPPVLGDLLVGLT